MLKKSEKIFLDTNVLIYDTFIDFDEEKHQIVNKAFEYFQDNIANLYISAQILREFYAISTNKVFFNKPLSPRQAIKKINEFRTNFQMIYETKQSVQILQRLLLKYEIKKQLVHDTNIIATMLNNKIKILFTFDIKDFSVFREINLFKIVS